MLHTFFHAPFQVEGDRACDFMQLAPDTLTNDFSGVAGAWSE